MEIVYIWLKEHKHSLSGVAGFHLKNQGFNFGGRFRFHYNHKTCVLTVRENAHWQDNFYKLPEQEGKERSLAKITNVTAIVGENGAGKTSLLDYIKRELVYGRQLRRQDAIVVLWDEELMTHHIYHHTNLSLEILTTQNFVYEEPKTFSNAKSKEGKYPSAIHALKESTFIFFSNVCDNKVNEGEYSRLRNISTNYLLKTDGASLENYEIRDFRVHRFHEVMRQITFIKEFRQVIPDMDFTLPDNLMKRVPQELNVTFLENDFNDENMDTDDLMNFYHIVTKELPLVNGTKKDEYPAFFMRYFTLLLVRHFLAELSDLEMTSDETISALLNSYLELDQFKDYKKIRAWFQIIASGNTLPENEGLAKVISGLANGTDAFWEKVNSLIETLGVTVHKHVLKIDISQALHIVDEILVPYRNTVISRDFLLLDWRDLSSGEKSLLNLYSRFFTIVKNDAPEKPSRLRDNLIILIDEGELYFHPQWQKDMLYNLLAFLPHLFANPNGEQRRIQIIMTSNSPFIISDLPSTNVIFLKREENMSVVLDGLDDQRQTFAANIHSLFAHSFFLTGGLMGKFAKEKINDVISLLVNENANTVRLHSKSVQQTIEIVGESVIRNKLMNMYRDKMQLDNANLEKRLEEQIAKLQDQLEKVIKINSLKRGVEE